MVSGKIQSLWCTSGVENRQNSFNCGQQVGTDPATIALLIEPLQAAMLEAPNHQNSNVY